MTATSNTSQPDDSDFGATELRRLMADVGGTWEDFVAIVSRLIISEVTTPSDAQTKAAWRKESEQFFCTHEVTPEDLAAAKSLYRRNPRVFRKLEELRLGDHPAVFPRFVELARKFKNR